MPVCSDLPFIDTQILEIPNPHHSFGVRGVGETPIVPPLAAAANAVSEAAGVSNDAITNVATRCARSRLRGSRKHWRWGLVMG